MNEHPSRSIDSELTCCEIANGGTDFLEGRLSTVISMKISDHLASCTGCLAHVRQIALVKDTLALLPKQFPSPINRLRLREHFVARQLR
ncbi:MAG: hypothetical protein AB7P24_10350 [Nitrospira sp.]